MPSHCKNISPAAPYLHDNFGIFGYIYPDLKIAWSLLQIAVRQIIVSQISWILLFGCAGATIVAGAGAMGTDAGAGP